MTKTNDLDVYVSELIKLRAEYAHDSAALSALEAVNQIAIAKLCELPGRVAPIVAPLTDEAQRMVAFTEVVECLIDELTYEVGKLATKPKEGLAG